MAYADDAQLMVLDPEDAAFALDGEDGTPGTPSGPAYNK